MTALGLAVVATEDVRAQKRETPYYASIAASKARMRTGPARTYPATWLYVRADLPIKVVAIYRDWRKVEDPDGTQGWMLVSLLSSQRTAIVRDTIVELRAAPNAGAAVNWRAEPGVVGRISKCSESWCWFAVGRRGGFVEKAHLWGVDQSEAVD
ncbi:SH3 domain-containing protein [Hephaestia sp. GCM10023244]|uniref:SH3 domain-containing protein n=1 Tax=unclassified Hephaestia TaxID=2631281 RepID=UPI0020774CBA|nr:SH3 domain-containing protein [Hephaestia sp. MAHUQ-44]